VNSFGFGGSNAHAILDDAYHILEALNVRQALQFVGTNESGRLAKPNGYIPNGVQEVELSMPQEVTKEGYQISNGDLAVVEMTSSTSKIPIAVSSNGDTPINTNCAYPLTNGEGSKSDDQDRTNDTKSLQYKLLVFSARDEAALQRVHRQYCDYYDNRIFGSAKNLRELASALAVHRNMMTMRSVVVANANLTSASIGLPELDCFRSLAETQLCFVFTGQGAQYAKMGLELMQYPLFRDTLIEADKEFQALGAEWSLFGKILRSLSAPTIAH